MFAASSLRLKIGELYKTLKREEIHASTYRDFEALRERMEEFIERY
jgi:hypothetical protein